jgi:hypothetical protein
MNVKELADYEFQKSGLEQDAIYQSIFQIAFELGYKAGQSRPPVSIGMITNFQIELESNNALKDVICMQSRMDQKIYYKMLSDFIIEQTALNRTYKDLADVQNHFRNWVRKKIQDNPNMGRTSDAGRL